MVKSETDGGKKKKTCCTHPWVSTIRRDVRSET
jgi:hypothetical protein